MNARTPQAGDFVFLDNNGLTRKGANTKLSWKNIAEIDSMSKLKLDKRLHQSQSYAKFPPKLNQEDSTNLNTVKLASEFKNKPLEQHSMFTRMSSIKNTRYNRNSQVDLF